MKKYIFPVNYRYANKFLGIIEYRVLLPLSIYGIMIFCILYLIKLDFFLSVGIFIFLFVPPTILLGVGIKNEPFLPFLISVYRFRKNAKIYLYSGTKKEENSSNITSKDYKFISKKILQKTSKNDMI